MAQIYVDNNALYSLKEAIGKASNDLTNIAQAIRTHFSDTLERLQKTMDYSQTMLDEAQRLLDKEKEILHEAEVAYHILIKFRKESRAMNMSILLPSLSLLEARASLCREIVRQTEEVRNMWLKKVRKAEEIKNDCEREINRYTNHGEFFHNSGGDGILTYLAEVHSSNASAKLENTINILQELNNTPLQ